MKKSFLIISICLFSFTSIAQLAYYQGEANVEFCKDPDYKCFNIPFNAIVQYSLLDNWILNRYEDRKFHFGDLLGVKGGVSIIGTSKKLDDLSKRHYNLMVNFGYYVGGFAGYNNEKIGFFLKFQQEMGANIRSSVDPLIYCTNVKSVSGLYKNKYYLEFGMGTPAKKLILSKDKEYDEEDRLTRVSFKYFEDEELSEYIGLTLELFNKKDHERITSVNITTGFCF